jgi:hypothetical protein
LAQRFADDREVALDRSAQDQSSRYSLQTRPAMIWRIVSTARRSSQS